MSPPIMAASSSPSGRRARLAWLSAPCNSHMVRSATRSPPRLPHRHAIPTATVLAGKCLEINVLSVLQVAPHPELKDGRLFCGPWPEAFALLPALRRGARGLEWPTKNAEAIVTQLQASRCSLCRHSMQLLAGCFAVDWARRTGKSLTQCRPSGKRTTATWHMTSRQPLRTAEFSAQSFVRHAGCKVSLHCASSSLQNGRG